METVFNRGGGGGGEPPNNKLQSAKPQKQTTKTKQKKTPSKNVSKVSDKSSASPIHTHNSKFLLNIIYYFCYGYVILVTGQISTLYIQRTRQ